MKKKLFLLVAMVLAVAFVFGGCGSKSSETSSSSDTDRTVKAKEILQAVDYNPTKYVKLPKGYMNLDISLENKYKVTDEQIEEYATSTISMYPYYVEDKKAKTVKDDSVVNIDYVGKMDGEEFDGGSAEDTKLTIGSGTFIDGFEDGLIGKKVGDTVVLDLTFPEDYSSEDLAGKDVEFTVTINYIYKTEDITYDTLTDDYVTQNFASSGMSTVDDFKSAIETQLSDDLSSQKESDLQEAVIDKLKDESTVTFPDGLVDDYIDKVFDSIESSAEEADMTVDEYLQEYVGESEDDYRTDLQSQVEDSVTQELILQAIIKKQKISIETSDFYSFVDQYVSYYGAYYGYSTADDFYDACGGKDIAIMRYAENEALTQVVDGANVTYDKKAEDSESTDSDTTESTEESDDSSAASEE